MQNESENEKRKHVRILKRDAQNTIDSLRKEGKIDFTFRTFSDGNYVYVPVKRDFADDALVVVEVPGRPNPEGKYPGRHRGSYDLIGEIAVIHRKVARGSDELAENILRYNKTVRSVFLDEGISGTSRTRSLKLLAGTDDKRTVYRENGIILNVDLSRAYFSPRLATERMRVARSVSDGENIIDMFAGIGPFSILISKLHNVTITAIDSNEDAISILEENIQLNHLRGTIVPVHADSMEYLENIQNADRILMNLPHSASLFLEKAVHSLRPGGVIHYYEICSVEQLESRMESFEGLNFQVTAKREVHGYSKSDRMYALDLMKIL